MTFHFEVCYCAGAAEYDNVVKRLTSREGLELSASTSDESEISVDGFRFLRVKDRRKGQPPTLQLIVDDLEQYCASLPTDVEYEAVGVLCTYQVLFYFLCFRNPTRWIVHGLSTLC